MTLGAVLLAIGIYFLKSPNGFATGGVAGIGTLLAVTLVPHAVWIRAHI